jgi:outer membrane protein TolC
LDDAWATALALDPWLEAQRLRTCAASESWRAAGAEAYPSVDVGTSYTVRDNAPGFVFSQPTLLPNDLTFPFAQRESAGYFALVNVPIYTGGAVPAAVDAARSRAAASELQYSVARRELLLRVAEEYAGVLRAQADLSLARKTAASLAAHARDAEMLFRHDQRPRNDLLAAQVALADARHGVIATENRLDAATAAYNRRLARPLETPVELAELSLEFAAEDLDALQAAAVEGREELAQLAADARALAQQAESIRARNRPQAAVTGGYVFNENRYQSPEGLTSVGVGVTWNVFDAGRDRHQAAALEQQSAALHRLRADQESRIRLEVRRAWLDVDETRRRLEVTAEALAQSEENLRVSQQRYANGMQTGTDVLAAESLRFQSFRNHHHAYYDAVLARLRLDRAAAR